jgi:hypothetical protein
MPKLKWGQAYTERYTIVHPQNLVAIGVHNTCNDPGHSLRPSRRTTSTIDAAEHFQGILEETLREPNLLQGAQIVRPRMTGNHLRHLEAQICCHTHKQGQAMSLGGGPCGHSCNSLNLQQRGLHLAGREETAMGAPAGRESSRRPLGLESNKSCVVALGKFQDIHQPRTYTNLVCVRNHCAFGGKEAAEECMRLPLHTCHNFQHL